jgi:hypothetical protein
MEKSLFSISEGFVRDEFSMKYGREPNDDEMSLIKDSLEWGLLTGIDIVMAAAFTEAINLTATPNEIL